MDNQFLNIEPKKDSSMAPKRHIEPGVISRAVYMITDLLDAGEPLKKALRTLAVGLLTDDDLSHIHKLQDTLKLSASIELISETNVQILLEAIHHIKPHKATTEKILYIEDMFTQNALANVSDDNIQVEQTTQNTPSVKTAATEVSVPESIMRSQKETREIKPSPFAHIDEKPIIQKPVISTVTALDIGARRKKILEVVKSKGQATIHEFIQSIQGCSSKTIQRELTSLVLSGTLKKTGERRWSKYSMR